nr:MULTISPECIES: type II secretion system F family protein [unclassified Actinomyces]
MLGALAALIVLLVAQSLRMVREPQIEELLALEATGAADDEARPGLFARTADFMGTFTQRLLRQLYGESRVRRLSRQLRAAGRPVGLTAQSFIQREAGFITVGALLMLLWVLNGRPMYGVVIFAVFSLWMHTWLYSAIRSRQREIERDLPDFLDVLAVTVAAGLPFRAALRRVSTEHSGPLAEEIATVLRELQLGVPRRAALEGLRGRNQSPSVASFVTALLQSEELGTPLEDALRQIAREVRRVRSQQVRQAATRAQPKVSLVVTMLIVPGTIVLVAGSFIVMNLPMLQGLFDG